MQRINPFGKLAKSRGQIVRYQFKRVSASQRKGPAQRGIWYLLYIAPRIVISTSSHVSNSNFCNPENGTKLTRGAL